MSDPQIGVHVPSAIHSAFYRRRSAIAIGVLLVLQASRCSSPPPEPLQLDGNLLTVYNSTAQDWSDVRIFLNTYYRAVTPKIPAGSQFKAPLDVFVEAYGRRFELNRTQIHAVRLTATLPGGEPLVLDKAFQAGGLAGALGGKK